MAVAFDISERKLLLQLEAKAREADDEARRRGESSRFRQLIIDLDIVRSRR